MTHKNNILAALLIALVCFSSTCLAEIFLPGMQPNEGEISFGKIKTCKMCHGGTKNGNADPYFSWQTSIMAHAGRDPLYIATVSIANQDIPGVGEFCWRCHAPRGWLEGRSSPGDGSALTKEDRQGITCEVCHRAIDPLSDEAAKLIKHVPTSYGNAMMVADPKRIHRGPYPETTGVMPHGTKQSDFMKSGNFCGVCHNISNPIFAKDVKKEPVHSFGHVERTFSEWQLSDYAKMGEKGSCQSCHYEVVKGGGTASKFGSKHRDYFVKHGLVGGSTWIQDAILMLNPKDVSKKAMEISKQNARKLLREAAALELTAKDNTATLKITNLTGHKLPSGYPEGRRMWVNAKFLGAGGKVLKEVGKYGEKTDTLFGKEVTVETMLDHDTTIYEIIPGISKAQAKKFGKKAGPSFHFVINDIRIKDNRIPPKGFNNKAFALHLSEPVGKTYKDGQYWDIVNFEMPPGCAKVEARLMYQSTSWKYIKFLAEENKTDDWGKKIYNVWDQTGKCPPVSMAESSLKIK